MVQIKFSIVTIFILVAAAIAPAIALPVPANGISNRAAEARKKISNFVKGAKKYVPVFGKKNSPQAQAPSPANSVRISEPLLWVYDSMVIFDCHQQYP